MREFGFELRLCARLEDAETLVARQLGAGVRRPGNRVLDVLCLEPGPTFGERAAITPHAIPDLAIEADVGAGRARPRSAAFADLDVSPERARAVVERAVEVGFLERERRDGREYVRRAAPYPADWFGTLTAVENKPDLAAPGELGRQLRTDVALGLVDEVVLATASRVTGAHRNRLPEEVGIWWFRDGEVTVVREPTPLPTTEPGVEIVAERPGRTEIELAGADAKARKRRRLAERAYGKGWRTYAFPDCARIEPDADGLPYCTWHGRVVDPASECGPNCPGHEPADAPSVALDAARDRASPWVADPEGRASRQVGLDRFG